MENNLTLSQSPHVSAIAYDLWIFFFGGGGDGRADG